MLERTARKAFSHKNTPSLLGPVRTPFHAQNHCLHVVRKVAVACTFKELVERIVGSASRKSQTTHSGKEYKQWHLILYRHFSQYIWKLRSMLFKPGNFATKSQQYFWRVFYMLMVLFIDRRGSIIIRTHWLLPLFPTS